MRYLALAAGAFLLAPSAASASLLSDGEQRARAAQAGPSAKVREAWGPLIELAGNSYMEAWTHSDNQGVLSSATFYIFKWLVPYKELSFVSYFKGRTSGETRFTLQPDGTLQTVYLRKTGERIDQDYRVTSSTSLLSSVPANRHGWENRSIFELRPDGHLVRQTGARKAGGPWDEQTPAVLRPGSWEQYLSLLSATEAEAARLEQARLAEQHARLKAEADQAYADAEAEAADAEWEAQIAEGERRMNEGAANAVANGLADLQRHNNELDRIARQGQARVAEMVAERQRPQRGGGGSTYSAPSRNTTVAAAPASTASTSGSGGLPTAYTFCYFFRQGQPRPWAFYISRIGSFPSATGAAWPSGSSGPVAASWGAHLTAMRVPVAEAGRGQYATFPMCYADDTLAKAEERRAMELGRIQRSSAGYHIEEVDWAPEG